MRLIVGQPMKRKTKPTGADRVLDGGALVERDLVIPANGADGTAGGRAQDGRVGGGRALPAHRVVSGGAGACRPVSVRAEVAGLADQDGLLLAVAVLVPGVFRLFGCSRLMAQLGIVARLALALRVVSHVALPLDPTVGRARSARPARRVAARGVAESGAGQAGLALGILQKGVIACCPVAGLHHARTGRALGAAHHHGRHRPARDL